MRAPEIIILCILLMMTIGSAFWIWMLIDCALNKALREGPEDSLDGLYSLYPLDWCVDLLLHGASLAQQTQPGEISTFRSVTRTVSKISAWIPFTNIIF